MMADDEAGDLAGVVSEDVVVILCIAPVLISAALTLWYAAAPLSEEERAQRLFDQAEPDSDARGDDEVSSSRDHLAIELAQHISRSSRKWPSFSLVFSGVMVFLLCTVPFLPVKIFAQRSCD